MDGVAELLFVQGDGLHAFGFDPVQAGPLVVAAKNTAPVGDAPPAQPVGRMGIDPGTFDNGPDFGLAPAVDGPPAVRVTTGLVVLRLKEICRATSFMFGI